MQFPKTTNSPIFNHAILFVLIACHFATGQDQPAVPDGVEAIRNIEYTKNGDKGLTLDVYRPFDWADLNSTPVVIWIPSELEPVNSTMAAYLAQQDMAVISINYSGTKNTKWPATIDDCYAAVRWVRENAKLYGFGDKIGVWGRLQGGQLAALMATRKFDGVEAVSSKVNAVCNFYGITKPLENSIQFDSDASPLQHVSSDDAPMLIVHAENDKTVPIEHSKLLHEKLTKAGVDSTFLPLPDIKLFESEQEKMQELVREFFKAHLF